MADEILLVVSAADELRLGDGTAHPTGFWVSEVVEPYDVLVDAGYDVVVATPGGRRPTPDARSLEAEGAKDDVERVAGLHEPHALSEIEDLDRFAAVVLPGGHGPMADLCADAQLGRVLRAAVNADVPVAAICHGPAGLLAARQDPDATWPFSGRAMTAFSDAEEEGAGLRGRLQWSLEEELRSAGAVLELAEPYTEKVVVDGLLVTGQNPASARAAAEALVDLLQR